MGAVHRISSRRSRSGPRLVEGGKNRISETTALARNGAVFDWTFHRPGPAALRKYSNGPCGTSRSRNGTFLLAVGAIWSEVRLSCNGGNLLIIARRDIRQLGCDDNGRHFRNRCALTNNGCRACCSTAARSSRYCRFRHDWSCDHFDVGVALVGAARLTLLRGDTRSLPSSGGTGSCGTTTSAGGCG